MNAPAFRTAFAVLTSFVLGAGLLRADSVLKAPTGPDPVSEALPLLKAGYVDFAGLDAAAPDRLTDLVARSQGEILLNPAWPDEASTGAPILSTLLPGQIAYLRLSSFQPATDWTDLTALLEKWNGDGAEGFLLDLRSNGALNDFEGAARIADLFTPAGAHLFSVRNAQGTVHDYLNTTVSTPDNPGVFKQPLVVLINGETAGAGEALAACLKANGAVLIGGTTMGEGALFHDDKLASGETLRYVAGQVTMADGTALWKHPVSPDIGIQVNPKKEKMSLELIGKDQIAEVMQEAAARHRMSEAALVRGEDPEIDAYLVSVAKQAQGPRPPVVPQDSVLIAAVDGLKAIRLSERPVAAPAAAKAPTDLPSSVQ